MMYYILYIGSWAMVAFGALSLLAWSDDMTNNLISLFWVIYGWHVLKLMNAFAGLVTSINDDK